MQMTEDQFAANARQVSVALVTICERKGITLEDSVKMIGAGCAEAIAHFIGHAAAAEHLRDIADIAESEVLRAN